MKLISSNQQGVIIIMDAVANAIKLAETGEKGEG